MNEEVTYIPYGEEQVELNPFLKKAADEVSSYVESKPWSKKTKRKFMEAYSDIMSKGIKGASIRDGQWFIDYNGDTIEFASKKDKDIYEKAAYYIKSQMESSISKKEEENKDLPIFNNDYFIKQFTTRFNNDWFGGRTDVTTDEWNELDPRGDKGLRGTTERARRLATSLQNFSDSLEEGKYNFKDTPYEDLSDLKGRISDAIKALNTPETTDDYEALNKLGINPRNYLYNGGDDKMQTDEGQTMTYNQYYNEYLPKVEQAKVEQEAAKLKQEQQATAQKQALLRQTQFSKLRFLSPKTVRTFQEIQQKYAGQNLGEVFNGQLDNDKISDLGSLFRYYESQGKLSSLSSEEKQAFGRFSNLTNRLRKINGIEGYYWDTTAKRIVMPTEMNGQSLDMISSEDLLNMPTLQQQKEAKLNTPRGGGITLTAADKADIAATLMDLGAVVDPEVISGTTLALGAATTRTFTRNWGDNFWGNLGGSAIDFGTAALGGLPLLGDVASGIKTIKGIIRLMAIPAVIQAVRSVPDAKAALDKIDINHPFESAKNLTPKDYRALFNVISGVYAGKGTIKSNLAERAVMKHAGIDTKAAKSYREWLNKVGITPTKVSTTKANPTIKLTVDGKETKITLDEALKNKLSEKVDGIRDPEARNKAVKEFLISEKIKIDEKPITSESKVEVKNSRLTKNNSYIRKRGLYGKDSKETIQKPRDISKDDFEQWLQSRNDWQKHGLWGTLGSNRYLRSIYERRFGYPTRGATSVKTELSIKQLPVLRNRQQTNGGERTIQETTGPVENPVIQVKTYPDVKQLPFKQNLLPTYEQKLLPPPEQKFFPRQRYEQPSVGNSLKAPSAKELGLPYGTDVNYYIRSAFGKNSAYNATSKKVVSPDTKLSSKVNFGNGHSLKIEVSDGKLMITDSAGNTLLKKHIDTKNYGKNIKDAIAKVVQEQRNKLIQSNLIKPFNKEFISSIKNMKRRGLLYKRGGNLLNSQQILENFYKQNNLL